MHEHEFNCANGACATQWRPRHREVRNVLAKHVGAEILPRHERPGSRISAAAWSSVQGSDGATAVAWLVITTAALWVAGLSM